MTYRPVTADDALLEMDDLTLVSVTGPGPVDTATALERLQNHVTRSYGSPAKAETVVHVFSHMVRINLVEAT